ncbi:MAG TPA: DUF4136 domain-containing protein [Pyrinomonadaceae bacterium]|jgi:predicted heme/steroid binding protein
MKMRNPSKSFLIMVVAVILFWCVPATAQDVKYNSLPGTDFAKYKTYKWVRVPNVQYPNQILDQQIMKSIDAQLATKGLTNTQGESADLYVAYQAAVNQEKQWNSYSTGGDMWGYGRWGGWGGYGGGMQTTTTTSSTIHIGTVNLDIYDVSTKQQIWRGEASKTLGSGKDPNKVQKNLDKAMAKMLKNYPPPLKKK